MKHQNFVRNSKKVILALSVISLVMAIVCCVLIHTNNNQEEQEPVMSIKILNISSTDTDIANKDEVEVTTSRIKGKEGAKLTAKYISNDKVYINNQNTVTLELTGTDETKYDSSNLKQSDIVVKVGGQNVTSSTTVSLSAKIETENGVRHTLTLSNIPGNGRLTIEIAANNLTDAAQNKNALTKFDENDPNFQEIYIDNTAPEVSFGTNGSTTYAKSISTTVTVTDKPDATGSGLVANSLKYVWTNSATAPADEASFTGTFTNGGIINSPANVTGNNWYLWILAKDNVGNVSKTKSNVFYLDNQGPQNFTVSAKYNNASGASYVEGTWAQEIYVALSATDSNSGIKAFQWATGSSWSTSSMTKTGDTATINFTAARNQTVKFRVIDNLDNASEEISIAMKVDNANPTIEASNITYGGTLSVILKDTLSGVAAWQVKAGSGTTAPTTGWTEISPAVATSTQTKTGLTAGTHTIWTKDASGRTAYKTITVSQIKLDTPTVSIDTDGKVTWNSVTGATGYQIKFTEDGTWQSATSGSKYIDKTSTGTKTAYVQAINSDTTNYINSDVGSKSVEVFSLTLSKGAGISAVSNGETSTTDATYYVSGKQVSIDATVSNGYTWDKWTKTKGTDPESDITKNTTVTIGENTTLTANAIDDTKPSILSATAATDWDVSNYVDFTATDEGSKIVGYNISTNGTTAPTEWIPVVDVVEAQTETKYEYNAAWARVFHHNNHWGEVYFTDLDEAKSITNNIDKYSVLSNIANYKNETNWEFLLQYPLVNATKYNRWTQTSNPITTSNASVGYTAVHADWTTNNWAGMALSANAKTLLDGSPTATAWYYAIGANTNYKGGMPGSHYTSGTKIVSDVNLWARIDNLTTTTTESITKRLGDIRSNGTYYVWVKDVAGNTNSKSVTVNKVDNTAPATVTITSTENGKATLTMGDGTNSSGVSKYYFGTLNPTANEITWKDYTAGTVTENVTAAGTYILGVKDAAGNVKTVSKAFYKTTLTPGKGTVSPTSVISMAGNSITLPTPSTVTGYTFDGWYDAESDGNKKGNAGASYTPTATGTLYGHWNANPLTFNDQTINKNYNDSATDTFNVTPATNGTNSYKYEEVSETNESNDTSYITITQAGVATIAKATPAGTYTYVIKATDNNSAAYKEATYTVVIEKVVATNPTLADTTATYDGNPHEITVSVKGSGGTTKYRTSADNSTWGDWSTTKPSLTDVGTIYVQAMVTGDSNHTDTTATSSKTITIEHSKTATASPANKPYTGSIQTGVTGNNVDWTGATTGTEPGEYIAYATPKSNYAWSDGTRTQKTVTWYITKINEIGTIITNKTGKEVNVTGTQMGALSISTQPNASIATASVNGTTLTVTGVANGTTSLVLTEAKGGYTLTVNITIDVTAPTLTGVTAQIVNGTSLTFNVSGGADTGGSGLAGYKVYNSSNQAQGSFESTSATENVALTSNTGWYSDDYVVKAYDAAGNETTTGVGISYYRVKNEAGLTGLATAVNAGGTFENRIVHQENNISISNSNWTPIGAPSIENNILTLHPFKGEYFGADEGSSTKVEKNITALTIVSDSLSTKKMVYAGLFGYINSAKISYINVNANTIELSTSDDITAIKDTDGNYVSSFAAGLVARAYNSEINHCTVTSRVEEAGDIKNYATNNTSTGDKYAYVGGIVGYASNTTINDCTNNATIMGYAYSSAVRGTLSRAGGIAGAIGGTSTITNCTNNKQVTGRWAVGGIVGIGANTISNCTNKGLVCNRSTDTNVYAVGGIAGYINSGDSIIKCTNTGDVTANKANGKANAAVGGIVGRNRGGIIGGSSANKCINSGTITSNDGKYAGGIVGMNQAATISYCSNSGDVTGSGHGNSTTGNENDAMFGGIAGYNYGGSMSNNTNTGNISSEYNHVGGIVGYNKGYDDNEDESITWALSSTGSFIDSCTNKGNVTGNDKVGGIAGENWANGVMQRRWTGGGLSRNSAYITNSTVELSATITGSNMVGGIVGNVVTGSINNCTFKSSGSIKGQKNVGGIAGSNDNSISDCKCTNGTIIATSSNENQGSAGIGGITGYNSASGSVYFSDFSATIQLSGNTGGIVGNNYGNISYCINKGTTVAGKSGNYCAGIAGRNYGYIYYCANKNSVNYDWENSKIIDSSISNVGGIAGLNRGRVDSCYNSGQIGGDDYVGGIAGRNYKSGSDVATLYYCYDRSNVRSSKTTKGTITGENYSGTITTCVYLSSLTTNSSGVGSGKTMGELKVLPAEGQWISNYEIDYQNINSGYPVLKWEYGDASDSFVNKASTPTDKIYYATSNTVDTSGSNSIELKGQGTVYLYIPETNVGTIGTISGGYIQYFKNGESTPLIYSSGSTTYINGPGKIVMYGSISSSDIVFAAFGKTFVAL